MTRALCAFLLLLAVSWPTSADNAKPLTTILLVARAELPDPNFKDSVVLVMNNIGPAPSASSSIGPRRIAVSHLFPDLERLAQLDDKVYFGGPCRHLVSVVSFFVPRRLPSMRPKFSPAFTSARTGNCCVKLLARDKPMEGLRIFIGYSGWAPGQLQSRDRPRLLGPRPRRSGRVFDKKSEHPWPEPTGAGRARTALDDVTNKK